MEELRVILTQIPKRIKLINGYMYVYPTPGYYIMQTNNNTITTLITPSIYAGMSSKINKLIIGDEYITETNKIINYQKSIKVYDTNLGAATKDKDDVCYKLKCGAKVFIYNTITMTIQFTNDTENIYIFTCDKSVACRYKDKRNEMRVILTNPLSF